MSWQGWLAAVACYGCAQMVSATRWQRLARPLGFRNRLWEFVSFYFIGNFFNLLLPTSVGGDVVPPAISMAVPTGAGRPSSRSWPTASAALSSCC